MKVKINAYFSIYDCKTCKISDSQNLLDASDTHDESQLLDEYDHDQKPTIPIWQQVWNICVAVIGQDDS